MQREGLDNWIQSKETNAVAGMEEENMKRIIAILLCLCLILTGCQSRKKTEENNKEETKENSIQKEDQQEQSGVQLLKLNSEWTKVTSANAQMPEFTVPAYEAKVEPYVINKDLSNIVNLDSFSGFTGEQIKFLAENGFVVLPTTTTKMHYIYDNNVYNGIPNFITSDSVMHLYHQFYDKSLTNVEAGYLYQDLDNLTKQMLINSLELYGVLQEEDLKVLQEKNIVYFLVARMLMSETGETAANISEEMAVNGKGKIPEKLITVAEAEFALINAAESYRLSPLLGFEFDYSQFTIRGHYTRSEELGRFFKTVMWYGTVPFPFLDKNGNYQYENTLQALLMTYATFMDSEICCAELWENIYQPTAQYVGLSDDIEVFTMNNLRKEVFGDQENPNIFNDDSYYDALLAAVKALPEPQIAAKLSYLSTPTGKQFRYMGQRYILDSEVMQTLIENDLRPYPSALDVMGALGSATAENLLFQHYKPQAEWPDYETRYKELKAEAAGYSPELWSKNLYNGWIWSIQEALTEFDANSGMPYFMTTPAWKYKALNTALGSYTELKHDTVLYGKQSVAEGGGDIDYAKYHYVEPNVPLYSKLLYLTDNTIRVLEDQGMMNEKLAEGASRYRELLKLLINCSIKELNNEKLSEEEYDQLLSYGGKLEGISQFFLEGITGDDYTSGEITDMLVTDVSTNRGTYVSLGTGYFDVIYVVIPVDGKLFLARGSVYSHYEFISDKRLTDEEWWELQGIKVVRETYADFPEYTEPSEDLPEQPFWTKNFKLDGNEVQIQEPEVEWSKMVQ